MCYKAKQFNQTNEMNRCLFCYKTSFFIERDHKSQVFYVSLGDDQSKKQNGKPPEITITNGGRPVNLRSL